MTSRSSRGSDTPALTGKLGRASEANTAKPKPSENREKGGLASSNLKVSFAMPKKVDVEPTAYHFEWDEIKNRSNIRKHGFDFADAEEMFRNNLLARPDTRQDYGERRWIGIRGRAVVVVFAERGSQIIRIISLRKASRHERKEYEKAIQDGLEAH
jgi:uncharacterized protein